MATKPFAHIELATCAHPECARAPNGRHGHCCVRCYDYHEQRAKPAHTPSCDTLQTLAAARTVVV